MPIPFLVAAGIAAAAAAGSAVAGAVGSSNAANAQKTTAEKAMEQQKLMWEQQQANQKPWLDAGRSSLADLLAQMQSGRFDQRLDPSQLANDPGYQFRMAEGQRALERSASARGMLNSGAALRSLSRYSQGVASDEYQNAWARNQAENNSRFGRMSGLAGMGQQSAQSLGALGAQHSGQMNNLYGAMGNAEAAGHMGAANAVSGGMNALGNIAMMGAGGFGGMGGGQQQIPQQPGYGYGQSTMGYPTGGFGPWR